MKQVCKLFALVLLATVGLVGCGEPEKQGISIGRGAIHLAQPAPELLSWLNANFRPDAKELVVLFWRTDKEKGWDQLGGVPTYNIVKDGKDMVLPIDRSNAGIGSRGVHAQLAPHSLGFKFTWRNGAWVEALSADKQAEDNVEVLYSGMLDYLDKRGFGKKI